MTDDDISDLEIALHGRAVQKPGRTPGPWFATYAQPGIWHINSGPRYGCGDIATVWGGPNDTPEADARLIADGAGNVRSSARPVRGCPR